MDKMTFAKPFGDMLKEKRKLRGLSQMGLAMKSGRSLRCIQYLEAGTQEPTLSTLMSANSIHLENVRGVRRQIPS